MTEPSLAELEAVQNVLLSNVEQIQDRIQHLESIAFEGDGLTRAVSRLGMNASALGEALLTVDKNQQKLAQVSRDLTALREDTVPREEATKVARALSGKARRHLGVVGVAVLALVAALAYTTDSNYEACLARNAQVHTQIQILRSFIDPRSANSASAVRLQQGISSLQRNELDCGGLYPVHN